MGVVRADRYVDGSGDQWPRAGELVFDNTMDYRVTYSNEDGDRFQVIFRQKRNPIGFHARLPGDK